MSVTPATAMTRDGCEVRIWAILLKTGDWGRSGLGEGIVDVPVMLVGSLLGELTDAGVLGAGVDVRVGFAAGGTGAVAVAAAAGAPMFRVSAGGAGPKALPGIRAPGGSCIANC